MTIGTEIGNGILIANETTGLATPQKNMHSSVPSIRNFDKSLAEQKQLSSNEIPQVVSAPGRSSKSYSKGIEVLLSEPQESPKSPNNVRFNQQGQTVDEVVEKRLGFSPRILSSPSCPRSFHSPRSSLDYERRSNVRSSSAPSVILRHPLDCSKVNHSPLVAEQLSPNKKERSFSPRSRTITQEDKIKSNQLNPRSFHKPSNKLENDDWIAELPYVTKEIKTFNKSLVKFLKKHMEKSGTPKPNFNQIKEEFKSEVKILFDRTLTKGTNQSIKRSPNTNAAISPRSIEHMKNVMTQIQKSEILTKRITSCIVKMKEGLILYLEESKQKTDWAMNLANLLSYLIHYKKDITKFMEHLDGVTDRDTAELMQNYVEKGLQKFLRRYANEGSYKLLKKDYGVIRVNFLDMQTIAEQVHSVSEPEDALIKFTGIEMEKITEEFKSYNDLCLTRLTINKILVNTNGLIGGGEDALKRFYTEFLCTFYQESQRDITREDIEGEVKKILKNENVPILIKEVLSLCVIPWKEFKDTTRLLYPGLQSGMVTLPEDGQGNIHIHIESDGTYSVTRIINYIVYQLKSEAKGSLEVPDRTKKLAKIEFVWTVTPCILDSGVMTWSGCIQIPKAVKIKGRTTYDEKWKILGSLINFAEIDQMTVDQLSVIKGEQEAVNFENVLYNAFNCSEPYMNCVQPSAFMIEFLAKNCCREALMMHQEALRKNPSENVDEEELVETIWEDLKINGKVLDPLLTRLSRFDKKLRRYLIINSKRTQWTDQLLVHIKELLSSKKYAEYGVSVEKDLNTFLKIIEEDIKDRKIRDLVLNVMCGRWEKGQNFQNQHIGKIIGTLKCLNRSPELLKNALPQMMKDIEDISMVINQIKNKTHEWVEPIEKKHPISSIDIIQIVRCFIPSGEPIFKKVTVNGVEVKSDELEGSVKDRQKQYFKRLLEAIYSQYNPEVNEEMLEGQSSYMVNYESSSDKELEHEKVLCLDLLKLCGNSCWMVADMFIRHLYDLHNAPIKSNMLQGMDLHIAIDKKGNYSVEHRRSCGVYPREVPDDIDSNLIIENQLLGKISFSWKLAPFSDNGRLTVRGTLQVNDVDLELDNPDEYNYIIIKALNNYHTEFRENPGWEDRFREPELIMPLSSYTDKKIISSPRIVKKLNTPR